MATLPGHVATRLGLAGHLRYSEAETAWAEQQLPFRPIDAAAKMKAGSGALTTLAPDAQWSYRAESSTRPAKAVTKPSAASRIKALEAENAALRRRLAKAETDAATYYAEQAALKARLREYGEV